MKPDTLSMHEVSPDCGRLLDEADRLLDEYDFTGSVAAFREAAHLGPLTSDWLMNFRIAEENEQIEFRKQLTRMFPASLDLALDEVEALGRAGFGPQAVARCSDLLKSSVLTPMQIRLIRHARFEVARKTRESALFADDFLYLWGESNALGHPARVQASLLKALIPRSILRAFCLPSR